MAVDCMTFIPQQGRQSPETLQISFSVTFCYCPSGRSKPDCQGKSPHRKVCYPRAWIGGGGDGLRLHRWEEMNLGAVVRVRAVLNRV